MEKILLQLLNVHSITNQTISNCKYNLDTNPPTQPCTRFSYRSKLIKILLRELIFNVKMTLDYNGSLQYKTGRENLTNSHPSRRAAALWFIVERTKQCLDFSCTWHLFHLIACWCYNGNFPTSFSWWLLNIACVSLMCVCGEFLCLRSELQAIPLSLGPKTDL